MPPESLFGGAASPGRSASEGAPGDFAVAGAPGDVFALGVTLHEMLAGATPFKGDSPLAMLYSIVNEPPAPIREARPEASEATAALIARMLEKDPAARATAEEVARELGAMTGLPVNVAPRTTPARRHRRPVPAVLVLVGLLIVAGGAAWWLRERAAAREAQAVIVNNEGHDSLSAGRLDSARRRFETALRLAPRYGEAKLNLAAAMHRMGDDNRAARLYAEVIAEHRRRPELLAAAHYGLGEIDLQSEAWPSAIEHLTEASRLDSTRVEYPNNLSFALSRAGHADRALATVRAAQARFPGEAALLKNAALAWFQVGRYDSALAAANEAVRLRPLYPAAWLIKERSEIALGDVATARSSLQTLRSLDADAGMLAEGEAALREAVRP
jgi:tetratricopeptide (TPR) repeat protein